jgi:hypothetical protein
MKEKMRLQWKQWRYSVRKIRAAESISTRCRVRRIM